MTTHTTVRSWPAMALGLFFASVTARVLLDDVVAGQPFTIVHLGSIAALVAALGAGHYVWPALRQGALVSGLILLLVAVGATGYIVVASGARNAERSGDKAAAAAEIARQRASLLKMRAEAAFLLADCPAGTAKALAGVKCGLREAMTAECRSGKGARCDGTSYSVRTYEAALDGYDAKLARLAPTAGPAAGYAHAAQVLAAVPFVTAGAAAIQAQLELLMPFASVIIGELGTLGFLYLGLGHRPGARRTVRTEGPGAAPAGRSGRGTKARSEKAESFRPLSDQGRGRSGRTVRQGREKAACLAELVTGLALGQSVPSQRTLADRWQRPKQTVSDWLGEWEAAGLIPPRRTVGREKALAAG